MVWGGGGLTVKEPILMLSYKPVDIKIDEDILTHPFIETLMEVKSEFKKDIKKLYDSVESQGLEFMLREEVDSRLIEQAEKVVLSLFSTK